MPINPAAVTWCVDCDWNVDPVVTKAVPLSRAAANRQRRADRSTQARFDRTVRSPVDRPYRGLGYIVLVTIALSVHVVTLVVAVGGLLAVLFTPLLVKLLVGVPAAGAVWLLSPRLGRMPQHVLRRADAPLLYELLDQVAGAVGAHAPDAVVIDGHFNASFGKVGLRRRRVLVLGVPLWQTLSPQQQVALLGHELGHDVNGDSRRGLIVSSALSALAHWHDALQPDRGASTLVEIAAHALLHTLAGATRGVYAVLSRLSFSDSQRAEYLADDLSARVAGTESVTGLLDAMFLADSVEFAIDRALRLRESDPWASVRAVVAGIPPRERERRRRAALRRPTRIDTSHPPTHLRIAFAAARGPYAARVLLSAQNAAKIDDELAASVAAAARELELEWT